MKGRRKMLEATKMCLKAEGPPGSRANFQVSVENIYLKEYFQTVVFCTIKLYSHSQQPLQQKIHNVQSKTIVGKKIDQMVMIVVQIVALNFIAPSINLATFVVVSSF